MMNKLLKILLSLVATGSVFYEINSKFNFVKIAIVDNPYETKEEDVQTSNTEVGTEPTIEIEEIETNDYVSIQNKSGNMINISVEVAKSTTEKEKGLSNRKYLGSYSGFLYVYDQKALYPFSIKNNLLLLDIIFIDDNGVIVDIKENVSPCLQESCDELKIEKMYQYILEVNGNFCTQNDIIIGNSVSLHLN